MHCVISWLVKVEVPIQLKAALCFALLHFSQPQESLIQFFYRSEMPPQNHTDKKNFFIHSDTERNEETKYSHCDITCMCFYPVFKLLWDSVHRPPVRPGKLYRVCHLKHNVCSLTRDINIVSSLDTSLRGCALLNASRTAAEYFDAK